MAKSEWELSNSTPGQGRCLTMGRTAASSNLPNSSMGAYKWLSSTMGGQHVRVRPRTDINQEAKNLPGNTPPQPSYVDSYQKAFGIGMGSLAGQGAQPRRSATGVTFCPPLRAVRVRPRAVDPPMYTIVGHVPEDRSATPTSTQPIAHPKATLLANQHDPGEAFRSIPLRRIG